MKRDLILVGLILKKLLDQPYSDNPQPIDVDFDEHDITKVDYHIKILKEFDMIRTTTNENERELPTELTWKGHEYIDDAVNSWDSEIFTAIGGFF